MSSDCPAEQDAWIARSWRRRQCAAVCDGSPVAAVTTPSTLKPISDWEFEQYVQAEVDGEATPEQLAVLQADRMTWRTSLLSLRRDAEEHLESARSLRGDERAQVIADLESEQYRLAAAWARHNNQPIPPRGGSREASRDANA